MQVPGVKVARRFCLATERVKFVGEPMACVVADDRYLAEDALDLMDVEYEPIREMTDPAEAMKGGVLVHEDIENNLYQHRKLEVGDVDSAFRTAPVVVEKSLKIQRHTKLIPIFFVLTVNLSPLGY